VVVERGVEQAVRAALGTHGAGRAEQRALRPGADRPDGQIAEQGDGDRGDALDRVDRALDEGGQHGVVLDLPAVDVEREGLEGLGPGARETAVDEGVHALGELAVATGAAHAPSSRTSHRAVVKAAAWSAVRQAGGLSVSERSSAGSTR